MFREKENKWTRSRGFWEINGGDILIIAASVFFLLLTIGGVATILLHPRIPGISELFSDPPPPPPPSPADQKLHLAPGEQEIRIFPPKAKPAEPKK